MSFVEKYKQDHIDKETKRWNDACENIKSLLIYENKYKEFSCVSELTYKILCLEHHQRYKMFGYGRIFTQKGLNGFPDCIGHCGLLSLLEGISGFIGYHIMDDGDPGIAYCKWSTKDSGPIICNKSDNDAHPYFHYSLEELRKEYPDAQYASVDNAIEVVNFHINEEERGRERARNRLLTYQKKLQKKGLDLDEEDLEELAEQNNLSEETLEFIKFIDELKNGN